MVGGRRAFRREVRLGSTNRWSCLHICQNGNVEKVSARLTVTLSGKNLRGKVLRGTAEGVGLRFGVEKFTKSEVTEGDVAGVI